MTPRDQEVVGDALHMALHPGHPWSGCSNPDIVYDKWIPRFDEVMRDAGYIVVSLGGIDGLRFDPQTSSVYAPDCPHEGHCPYVAGECPGTVVGTWTRPT